MTDTNNPVKTALAAIITAIEKATDGGVAAELDAAKAELAKLEGEVSELLTAGSGAAYASQADLDALTGRIGNLETTSGTHDQELADLTGRVSTLEEGIEDAATGLGAGQGAADSSGTDTGTDAGAAQGGAAADTGGTADQGGAASDPGATDQTDPAAAGTAGTGPVAEDVGQDPPPPPTQGGSVGGHG